MNKNLEEAVLRHEKEIIAIRRELHRYPELSGQEKGTAELVARKLEEMGLKVARNVGGYGVVALLEGSGEGKTVAVRSDMDALPLRETTGLEYASRNRDVMHACGHDIHMAVALGTACVLSERRDEIAGCVKFIFQPAEELAPIGGALPMIQNGVMENPTVEAILGLHVWPAEPSGTVSCRPGPLMAALDKFKISVQGLSAHAATPHLGTDAITIAAQIVTALQTLISRNVAPWEMATLTVGTIHGGAKDNILAETVDMEGTIRSFSSSQRDDLEQRLCALATGIAKNMGGDCKMTYERGYPAVINDAAVVDVIRGAVAAEIGADCWREAEFPDMTAEDFARFLEMVPGAMFWLGCSRCENSPRLHTSRFDPDESCIAVGVRVMAAAVLDLLA